MGGPPPPPPCAAAAGAMPAPPPPRQAAAAAAAAAAGAALVDGASLQHEGHSDEALLTAGGVRPARRRGLRQASFVAAPLLLAALAAPAVLRWRAGLVGRGPVAAPGPGGGPRASDALLRRLEDSAPTSTEAIGKAEVKRELHSKSGEHGTSHGHKASAKASHLTSHLQCGPQRVAAQTLDTAKSFDVADIDGDGAPDIVYAAPFDNMVYWFRNAGGGSFDALAKNVTAYNETYGPCSVKVVDLVNDSLPDVLVASMDDGKVSVYPGMAGGKFGSRQVITQDAWGASFANVADMNGDGRLDVLSASRYDNKVAWYENGGGSKGGWGDQMKISEDQWTATSVYAADVDGDGYLDIISAGPADSTVAWYKYDDESETWAKHVVGTVDAQRSPPRERRGRGTSSSGKE